MPPILKTGSAKAEPGPMFRFSKIPLLSSKRASRSQDMRAVRELLRRALKAAVAGVAQWTSEGRVVSLRGLQFLQRVGLRKSNLLVPVLLAFFLATCGLISSRL